jgi:hypothetical protein
MSEEDMRLRIEVLERERDEAQEALAAERSSDVANWRLAECVFDLEKARAVARRLYHDWDARTVRSLREISDQNPWICDGNAKTDELGERNNKLQTELMRAREDVIEARAVACELLVNSCLECRQWTSHLEKQYPWLAKGEDDD